MEIAVAIYGEDGIHRRETIPAIQVGLNCYRVLGSPGFANGFAKGDILELVGDLGDFKVIKRFGNICVQIFYTGNQCDALKEFNERFEKLGGALDGGSREKMLIYTIPFEAGFPAIEGVFHNVPDSIKLATWMYGNVYADDGKPLNWWVGFRRN